ncbi:hypothetical protein GEMRC1_006494 [Eukaryota sp. GEM-RC1]
MNLTTSTVLSDTWVIVIIAFLVNILASVLLISCPSSASSTVGTKVLREVRRKGFHINGFLYPSMYYILYRKEVVTKSQCVLLSCMFSIIFALFELLRLLFPTFNRLAVRYLKRVMRKKERNTVTNLFHFANGAAVTTLLFPPAATMIGMADVVVGDIAAALTGVAFGKIRIKGKKTLEGTLGCIVACFLMAFVFSSVALEAPLYAAFIIGTISSLFATIAELYADSRLDDNFIMPIAGAFGCVVAVSVFDLPVSFWNL